MKLKILALSDTHLGEDVSLLSYPQGRQHLWKIIRTKLGDSTEYGDRIDIDEMVLVGDIPDRALSSTAEIMTATNAFIQMIGSAANVKKAIYVPGNHDHTLWSEYFRECYKQSSTYYCTKPSGKYILKQGNPCDLEGSSYDLEHSKDKSAKDLLAIFFGYPFGSSWLQIQKDKALDFIISNPLYATQIHDRTYVFTHGTHFKDWVINPLCIQGLGLLDIIDKLLVGIEINSGCDVKDCKNLEMLEERVAPFTDSIWTSSKNNPTGLSDRYWYFLKQLSSQGHKSRETPNESMLFSYSKLKAGLANNVIKNFAEEGQIMDKSVELWSKYFLPHMLEYLKKYGQLQRNLTFIYGDTHNGGWGEISGHNISHEVDSIRVYNTGGWIAHEGEGHPACHIFAVDDKGKEYMLDVSFKGVEVGDEYLLDLAAKDLENHSRISSNILKTIKREPL